MNLVQLKRRTRHANTILFPAVYWTEALPVGNGRLGAMVFGGIEKERIALNEDTLWSGYPKDRNNPDAKEALPKVRELIAQEKYEEADRLCKQMLGSGCAILLAVRRFTSRDGPRSAWPRLQPKAGPPYRHRIRFIYDRRCKAHPRNLRDASRSGDCGSADGGQKGLPQLPGQTGQPAPLCVESGCRAILGFSALHPSTWSTVVATRPIPCVTAIRTCPEA